MKGRRTNLHRLGQSFTKPTLQATPGDLSLVLPKRHLDNIIEMIQALDRIAPGSANDDTLLYGVEVKFYSSRLSLSKELKRACPMCLRSEMVPELQGDFPRQGQAVFMLPEQF